MKLLTLFLLFSTVLGDVYLHNPRGNNNRCDRRTNDRRNANRLFDSQNNAAGGYAAPCSRPENANSPNDINCYQMNYYMGTVIPLDGHHNIIVEIIMIVNLLYNMHEGQLGNNIRDGHPQNSNGDTCTDTIPEQLDDDIDNMNKYGKHESIILIIKDVDKDIEILDFLQLINGYVVNLLYIHGKKSKW